MNDLKQPWLASWDELSEIARGGQGSIYKLVSKSDSQRFAVLKRIVSRWRNDDQAVRRLKQEAEALSKLSGVGASVPQVYDSYVEYESAEPFILMEFIPGVRFDEWLAASSPGCPTSAAILTLGIAKTIAECHQLQIGHRDLKPANIILRDGNVDTPYILDFGIAFDSRQSVILTREGEMFWNEFIILPECQDLEGSHRDLRSDVTALVGLFFTCLTGRPPIVLRDAQELAPHVRHEELIFENAHSLEQAERLMWFFDRGFAYRLEDRFQTLAELTGTLQKFADLEADVSLDLVEQFEVLDQAVQATDRGVQLAALRAKHVDIMNSINGAMSKELNKIQKLHGTAGVSQVSLSGLNLQDRPVFGNAELISGKSATSYAVSREHYSHSAGVLLVAFADAMQIKFFAASYSARQGSIGKSGKQLEWAPIAVIDENVNKLSNSKSAVIVQALNSRLALEVRNLIRGKRSSKP